MKPVCEIKFGSRLDFNLPIGFLNQRVILDSSSKSTESQRMSDPDLFTACNNEVDGLHDFFVDWMGAKIDRNPVLFKRFTDTVADTFTLISPSGEITPLDSLIPELEGAYAARPDFKIWIKNSTCRFVSDDQCLMTYEEWQIIAGVETARLSTALFSRREGTPNGVEWVHVHETWLPGKSD
jgi:hypothetical protein